METGGRRQPYGRHRARCDLGAVLPLAAPLSLLIDPAGMCNFRCVFCPTGDPALLKRLGRPRQLLDEGLFARLCDDIAAFGQPIKSVHLYKDGEPLLHPRLPAFVAVLKERGLARTVEVTTNGSLLTATTAAALLAAGLDGIRISVYGPDRATYAAVTGRQAWEAVRDGVIALHRLRQEGGFGLHIHVKLVDQGLTEAQRRQFEADFAPFSDSVFIHPLHGQPLQDPAFATTPAIARRVCSEPFLKLAVNAEGTVSACCADWNRTAVVGDLRRETLREIWEGAALRQFRLTHLRGDRHSLEACRACTYVATLPVDNDLDALAESLWSRYAAPDGSGL